MLIKEKFGFVGRLFSPIKVLKVSALGYVFAIEYSKLDDAFSLHPSNEPILHNKGAVILFREKIIPIVDYRATDEKFKDWHGRPVIVIGVRASHVAIIVDSVLETSFINAIDIDPPCEERRAEFPYCDGQISTDDEPIQLVDLEKFLELAVADLQF